MKGFTLYNNAQVKLEDNISIDISSLKDLTVECELSPDDALSNLIQICLAKPPNPCNPRNQYQGRSSFFNDTKMKVGYTDVLQDGFHLLLLLFMVLSLLVGLNLYSCNYM